MQVVNLGGIITMGENIYILDFLGIVLIKKFFWLQEKLAKVIKFTENIRFHGEDSSGNFIPRC